MTKTTLVGNADPAEITCTPLPMLAPTYLSKPVPFVESDGPFRSRPGAYENGSLGLAE